MASSPFVDITKPFIESRGTDFVDKVNNFIYTHLDYTPEMKHFFHNQRNDHAIVLVFASGVDAMLFKLTVIW